MLVSHLSCSNKESDPEKYALKLKQHSGGIHHCQYSCDGSRVLSCSSMGDVKVCVGGGGGGGGGGGAWRCASDPGMVVGWYRPSERWESD